MRFLKNNTRYLTTLFAYGLIGWFLTSERRLRQGAEAASLEPGAFDQQSTQFVGRAFLVSLLAVAVAPVLTIGRVGRIHRPQASGWCGIALMVSGIGLRTWANRTLGRFYTRTLRVTEQHALVDQGPYHVIRHPGYSGSLLLWIGSGLATTNWLVLAVTTIPNVIAYTYRVGAEEAMLQQAFGTAYDVYRQRTWKLIPLIY